MVSRAHATCEKVFVIVLHRWLVPSCQQNCSHTWRSLPFMAALCGWQ